MGEYFCWVNAKKKEYISPYDFDLGNKRYETIHRDNALLRSLRSLMVEEWKGSQIVFLGDECTAPKHDPSGIFSKIMNGSEKIKYNGYTMYDFITESYTDVSGKFKAAEKLVREEIGFYLEDVSNGKKDVINEYGVDIENPYEGLFLRDGSDFRYTINLTRNVCYSFEDTSILREDGSLCDFADPLPMLMGYGCCLDMGPWVGDIISFANEINENTEILKQLTINF